MTDNNLLQFKPRPYRTAELTIDAFWYLVRLNDPDGRSMAEESPERT